MKEEVRVILDKIEADLKEILEKYVFEFNDDIMRKEITFFTGDYLEKIVKTNQVLSASAIMDEKNNPTEVVDAQLGIVDLVVEDNDEVKHTCRFTMKNTGIISKFE